MSHWIGIPGEYERTIVNMDQVIYITSDYRQNIEIHFVNGSVKSFKGDFKKMMEELEKRGKTDGNRGNL